MRLLEQVYCTFIEKDLLDEEHFLCTAIASECTVDSMGNASIWGFSLVAD